MAEEVHAPRWLHRFIIGRKGQNLREITENLPKLHLEFNADKDAIFLEGPLAEVLQAKGKLEDFTKDLVRGGAEEKRGGEGRGRRGEGRSREERGGTGGAERRGREERGGAGEEWGVAWEEMGGVDGDKRNSSFTCMCVYVHVCCQWICTKITFLTVV